MVATRRTLSDETLRRSSFSRTAVSNRGAKPDPQLQGQEAQSPGRPLDQALDGRRSPSRPAPGPGCSGPRRSGLGRRMS